MQEADITIIGAGVVGLAIAYKLSELNKNIIVVDKNTTFGQEISSRNSEVIHAGLYYPPESFKAKTCIRGKELLYEVCAKNNIAYKRLGKLIVAPGDLEIEGIRDIYKNAVNCGIKDLRFLERGDIKKLEPGIEGKLAIFSPTSGIVDTHALMNFFYQEAKQNNVIFAFSSEVVGINKLKSLYELSVKESNEELFSFNTHKVINSAGLYSDNIAELSGIDITKYRYRLHYCKGQYFRIKTPEKYSIKHLIYPPATKIDLGIHITPDLAGGLRLGPDAKYVNKIDFDVNEKDKETFLNSLKKFLPALQLRDLIPDTAGIRPKLQGKEEGFRDFVISEETKKGFPGLVNLIGIESPGLTACLAIAEISIDLIKDTC